MKKFALLTSLALTFPLAAFAQTGASSSMSGPTTPSTPTGPASSMSAISPMSSTSGGMTKLSTMDKKFINLAAIGGLAEVNDGQLAEQMGDDTVKQIGTRMVVDHGKANDELAHISQQLGDPVPMQTDAKHMQMSASLKTMSGASFDTAYLKDERLGHEKTIALFRKEISGGSNAQLKNFAQTTLPIIEGHLSMIKSAL